MVNLVKYILHKYQVFSDIQNLSLNFPHYYDLFPGSIFVFNYRNINKWICSRLNHLLPDKYEYIEFYKSFVPTLANASFDEIIAYWELEYNMHKQNVINYFENRKDSLIMYNIDEMPICDAFVSNYNHKIGQTTSISIWKYVKESNSYIFE